jgi:hypothetical protein
LEEEIIIDIHSGKGKDGIKVYQCIEKNSPVLLMKRKKEAE